MMHNIFSFYQSKFGSEIYMFVFLQLINGFSLVSSPQRKIVSNIVVIRSALKDFEGIFLTNEIL